MAPARIALEHGLEEHPGHPMLLDDLLQLLLLVCTSRDALSVTI